MKQHPRNYRLTLAEARERLAETGGKTFVELLHHGSMSIEFFSPHEIDTQQPHVQDEIYVVVSGSGEFLNGSETHAFGPGDVLFVPAGVVHRFEEFTEDTALWVIFYGPTGGESRRD